MLQLDQWKQLQGMEKHMEREITKMIRVYGIVQGVGFRPTVSRHAMARGIRGSVSNKGPYVEIFAQGKQQDVDAFIADIGNKPPKRSAILKLLEEPVEEPEKFTQFDIIESEKTKGEIFVSPDIAICDECKAEMFDPENRRYLHPFINCTCCGPRLTILDSLPYDRERTSMKEFPMCPSCAEEFFLDSLLSGPVHFWKAFPLPAYENPLPAPGLFLPLPARSAGSGSRRQGMHILCF